MKIYRGRLAGTSWDDAVVEVCEADPPTTTGRLIGVLPHVVKHSPSGFSWGYAGSGPSELARCILIDHLGVRGQCARCNGQGDVPLFDVVVDNELVDTVDETDARAAFKSGAKLRGTNRRGTCPACHGEGLSFPAALYQRFKFERVANWPQHGWQITAAEIDLWLAFDHVRAAAGGQL